jgi:hypothetical protein
VTRINGGSPQRRTNQNQNTQAPAAKAQAKAQAPETKAQGQVNKATTPQVQQKGDGFDPKSKQAGSTKEAAQKPVGPPPERLTKNFSASARNDIKALVKNNSDDVKVTTNKDGSETRKYAGTTNNGQVTQEAQLTTSKGLLREAQTKYTHSAKTTVQGGTNEVKTTASSKSDMLGQTTSSQTRESTQTRGDLANGEYSKTKSRTDATDQFGLTKTTQSQTNQQKFGSEDYNLAESRTKSQTTDRFGNKSVSDETKVEVKNGKTTVSVSEKTSSGTELTTSSSTKFEEGKFSIGQQADWKKNSSSTEKSYSNETERKKSAADQGFTQAHKSDKLSKGQLVGDLAHSAAPKLWESKGEIPKDKMKEDNWAKNDPNTFHGTRQGYEGKYEASIGTGGLKAKGNFEAKTGIYHETKTPDIQKGEAGAQRTTSAKIEGKFSADGKATINTNGVDASAGAKVGVTAEASVTGKAQSKSIKIAGEDVNVSAEATGKVSAEASAEAKVKAKITRNPPTAIVEGSVGASAVAKAEVETKVSAGPFAVKGNAYASAGAEATAKGSIGYEDGKLKFQLNAGLAVGVGGGAGVNVEVDVNQIGNMAKNTATEVGKAAYNAADVNNDGKLGLDDATAAVQNVANTVNNAANTVKGWFGW